MGTITATQPLSI